MLTCIKHIMRGTALLALLGVPALSARAQLKINEVYYNVSPQGGNQFVELLNTAATNVFLDGLLLTDEAGFGTEGVFQFPGSPGGTTLPVPPGGRVIVAVDAVGDTASADWECYAGGADADNPTISNLVKVAGFDDLGFSSAGDNCLLATGTDITVPIDSTTVLDGMNIGDGGGEQAPVAAGQSDQAPVAVSALNQSLGRCLDGADSDFGSAQDFFAGSTSMGAANECNDSQVSIANAEGPESNSGTNLMTFTVALNPASTNQVSVLLFTSDGTATAEVDYRTLAGIPLVFAPGVTNLTADVPVLGDTLEEGNETFRVYLRHPTNGIVIGSGAQGLILDEESGIGTFTSAFTRIRGSFLAITTEWQAVSGRTYQVQVGTTLMTPIWTNMGGVVTSQSTAASAVDASAGTATQRFYRVLQLD